MTVPTDPFNFTNGSVADADQVDARFLPLYTALAGALDVDNLLAAVKDKLGLSDAGVVRRGKSIVAASEARANAAYGLMTTPDRVQNLVLPTSGLIFVAYQATWKESVSAAARAGLFIGPTQAKISKVGLVAAPAVQEASIGGGTADRFCSLASSAEGLLSNQATAALAVAYTADVTTGQIVGGGAVGTDALKDYRPGMAVLFAAAGTYDVSVQFKASSGSVTAQDRKLWVWTMAF